MEIGMQAKLLKVIEEKKVTRIGGTKPIPIDVKVISAVNELPEECVRRKKMREDLLYRLSVVRLNIPGLAERKEDIPLLVRHFIDYYNHRMGKNVLDVSEEVEELFMDYSWPGNVREMKNIIEGAFNLLSSRVIQLSDLPEYLLREEIGTKPREGISTQIGQYSLQEMVSQYEKQLITEALKESKSLSEAARKLKITKQGLSYKLGKYRIGEEKQ